MSDSKPKLCPCPFCGSRDVWVQWDHTLPASQTGQMSAGYGLSQAFVQCQGCGAQGPSQMGPGGALDDVKAGAAGSWNTRRKPQEGEDDGETETLAPEV